ncbi:uncharacterized protein LOC111381736 [Olea europaea var. sylvestris]|uniref:uncharacterized protein LOC111381736 n=1 Tax=Olea europaea var. sylvestris TaxID=158386 RepID=UPI000C1D8B47|nr:uncharacterized protein LOC111381736 [Olea europaea var. sylvestris]
MLQISSYTKFLNEMLKKKTKLPKYETVVLTKKSGAKVQSKLSTKLKYPECFTLPISIENSCSISTLCDTVDRTIPKPCAKVDDKLIKVEYLIFPLDFIVLDVPKDQDIPVIMGWSFLVTDRTLIDMEKACEIFSDVKKIDGIFTLVVKAKEDAEKILYLFEKLFQIECDAWDIGIANSFELRPFDPEIERTFWRLRVLRRKEIEEIATNDNQQQQAIQDYVRLVINDNYS